MTGSADDAAKPWAAGWFIWTWLAYPGGGVDRVHCAFVAALLRIELQDSMPSGLMTGVSGFSHYGMAPMALFTFACMVFAPLGRVVALLSRSLLMSDRRPKYLARLYRFSETLRPGHARRLPCRHADFDDQAARPGAGGDGRRPVVLMGLVWCLALFDSIFDATDSGTSSRRRRRFRLTLRRSAACIATCCRRARIAACGATLHRRRPESVQITWALVVSGAILYIPANLYPVFTIVCSVTRIARRSGWRAAAFDRCGLAAGRHHLRGEHRRAADQADGLAWLLISVRYPQRRYLRANTNCTG